MGNKRYIPVANENRSINKNLCFHIASIAGNAAFRRLQIAYNRIQEP